MRRVAFGPSAIGSFYLRGRVILYMRRVAFGPSAIGSFYLRGRVILYMRRVALGPSAIGSFYLRGRMILYMRRVAFGLSTRSILPERLDDPCGGKIILDDPSGIFAIDNVECLCQTKKTTILKMCNVQDQCCFQNTGPKQSKIEWDVKTFRVFQRAVSKEARM